MRWRYLLSSSVLIAFIACGKSAEQSESSEVILRDDPQDASVRLDGSTYEQPDASATGPADGALLPPSILGDASPPSSFDGGDPSCRVHDAGLSSSFDDVGLSALLGDARDQDAGVYCPTENFGLTAPLSLLDEACCPSGTALHVSEDIVCVDLSNRNRYTGPCSMSGRYVDAEDGQVSTVECSYSYVDDRLSQKSCGFAAYEQCSPTNPDAGLCPQEVVPQLVDVSYSYDDAGQVDVQAYFFGDMMQECYFFSQQTHTESSCFCDSTFTCETEPVVADTSASRDDVLATIFATYRPSGSLYPVGNGPSCTYAGSVQEGKVVETCTNYTGTSLYDNDGRLLTYLSDRYEPTENCFLLRFVTRYQYFYDAGQNLRYVAIIRDSTDGSHEEKLEEYSYDCWD